MSRLCLLLVASDQFNNVFFLICQLSQTLLVLTAFLLHLRLFLCSIFFVLFNIKTLQVRVELKFIFIFIQKARSHLFKIKLLRMTLRRHPATFILTRQVLIIRATLVRLFFSIFRAFFDRKSKRNHLSFSLGLELNFMLVYIGDLLVIAVSQAIFGILPISVLVQSFASQLGGLRALCNDVRRET